MTNQLVRATCLHFRSRRWVSAANASPASRGRKSGQLGGATPFSQDHARSHATCSRPVDLSVSRTPARQRSTPPRRRNTTIPRPPTGVGRQRSAPQIELNVCRPMRDVHSCLRSAFTFHPRPALDRGSALRPGPMSAALPRHGPSWKGVLDFEIKPMLAVLLADPPQHRWARLHDQPAEGPPIHGPLRGRARVRMSLGKNPRARIDAQLSLSLSEATSPIVFPRISA